MPSSCSSLRVLTALLAARAVRDVCGLLSFNSHVASMGQQSFQAASDSNWQWLVVCLLWRRP